MTPFLKKNLRQEINERAKNYFAHEESAFITQLTTLPEWEKIRSVLLYAPIGKEPSFLKLLEIGSTRRFFFPKIHHQKLDLYEWSAHANWIVGSYGIREPDPKKWRLASLAEIDLILVPGLAFDAQGGRLGRGAGFYDRLLGDIQCHALKVGVAWEWQIVPKVPCEIHDVKMDIVITPSKIYFC